MAREHVDELERARETMVRVRRQIVSDLGASYSENAARHLVIVQEAIAAIDQAIADEDGGRSFREVRAEFHRHTRWPRRGP